jgi:hypothetical protein
VRGTDWKQPALWAKYGRHWSPYLLHKIEILQQQAAAQHQELKKEEA